MTLYVALDVSLEKTAVCVMDAEGTPLVERAVPSDAVALAELLVTLPERPERIGLEAGPLSEWLVRGLANAGFAAVLMETRQVRAALSSMTVKTDRNDAPGMAHLLRMGWFRPVHVKSMDAREQRVLLSARASLVRRLRDTENSVRGLLRGFGFRFPRALRVRWAQSVREALAGNPVLLAVIDPLLAAGAALRDQLAVLEKRVRDAARQDPVCHRLMTMPGVGAVVALTFRAAVDRPERFSSSKAIGPCFGLTPRRYQSGETDRTGTISRAGDAAVQNGPRSRSPARSASSSIGCGSTEPISASPTGMTRSIGRPSQSELPFPAGTGSAGDGAEGMPLDAWEENSALEIGTLCLRLSHPVGVSERTTNRSMTPAPSPQPLPTNAQ